MRGRFEGGMLRAPRRGGAERPRPGAGSTSCASAWTLPAAARTILRTNACRSLPRHFSVCWYDAAMSDRDPLRLIWIDLEMTGLKPDSDHIIEIATIVTDKHLNTLAEGPVLAIHQSDAVLDAMDDWNRRQHGTSGLAARVRASTVTAAQAERATVDFLAQWIEPGVSPMCGNSICQDRRFLAREMPSLERYYYHQHLDVTRLTGRRIHRSPGGALFVEKSST